MARKNNNVIVETTVISTPEKVQAYNNAVLTIRDSQDKSEGLAERIAANLLYIREKKLYMLEEAGSFEEKKGFSQWVESVIGISSGTASDSANTFARFGSLETMQLKPEYQAFAFSSLMKMKKLSDEAIERAGIVPTMSRVQIVQAIEGLKVLELEDKQKEEVQSALNLAIEQFRLIAGNKYKVLGKVLEAAMPEYPEHVKDKVQTLEEMSQALEITRNMTDLWKHGECVKTLDEYKLAIAAVEDEQEEEEYSEKEQKAASNDAVGAIKVEEAEEPEIVFIDINDNTDEQIIEGVKVMLDSVRKGQYQIVIR